MRSVMEAVWVPALPAPFSNHRFIVTCDSHSACALEDVGQVKSRLKKDLRLRQCTLT